MISTSNKIKDKEKISASLKRKSTNKDKRERKKLKTEEGNERCDRVEVRLCKSNLNKKLKGNLDDEKKESRIKKTKINKAHLVTRSKDNIRKKSGSSEHNISRNNLKNKLAQNVKKSRKTVLSTKKTSKGAVTSTNKNDNTDNVEKSEESSSNVASTKSNLFNWTEEEYLAESENLNLKTAQNIIKLFSGDNTIPFIARYRGDLTGGLKPEKLRKIKETHEKIQLLFTKAEKLIKLISSKGPVKPDLLESIKRVRTLEELEFIGAPYKDEGKRTLAERAAKLGLKVPAELILEGKEVMTFEAYVDPYKEGLKNASEVRLGIQHVIADIISKTPEVLQFLEAIKTSERVELKSKLKVKDASQKNSGESKYILYKDFSARAKNIRPHQILAINRGESENELSVKIVVPDCLWMPLKTFCWTKWLLGVGDELKRNLILDSVEDAIKRLLGPLVMRSVRSRLNKEAEEEALRIFGANLRQLLLTRPCPGSVVMGIDPGYKNGCKMAVVSPTGNLLAYNKFSLHSRKFAAQKIANFILKYKCSLIALGNGVGCRDTEILLTELIEKGIFYPFDVNYSIVSEQGVSIYSCSSVAADEFPDLEPTIISAVSLARRLQNPLSELVKVEPKHLGVGMYQHDVADKKLVSTLNEIVSECVSFVGVDINTASVHLLKHVAGLNETKAKDIIKFRSEIGIFTNRQDIKKVKGIKEKTFQQCAGFIRVLPSTLGVGRFLSNPLDQTAIHPESYEAVERFLIFFNLNITELGSPNFINAVKSKMEVTNMSELAKFLNTSTLSLSFIVDCLTKPLDFDMRSLSHGPIFTCGIKKSEQISKGQHLTGVVKNVVSFGVFVDVGIEFNGLIHISHMKNQVLELNERISVEVLSVDPINKKLSLLLLSKIT